MAKNPYVLVPGEIYSPAALFERYLHWVIWYGQRNLFLKRKECNEDLFNVYACCSIHNNIENEKNLFNRYLKKVDPGFNGRFGYKSIEYWARNFCPEFSYPDLIVEYQKYWFKKWNDIR